MVSSRTSAGDLRMVSQVVNRRMYSVLSEMYSTGQSIRTAHAREQVSAAIPAMRTSVFGFAPSTLLGRSLA